MKKNDIEYTKYLNEYITALNETSIESSNKEQIINLNNYAKNNIKTNLNSHFRNFSLNSFLNNVNINIEDILLLSLIIFLYTENTNNFLVIIFLTLLLIT